MKTVIYEITAIVRDAERVAAYEKYMRGRHIPELLATGYFGGAKFTRAAAAAAHGGAENRYRIQYEARDEKALREYLEKEAGQLRADFAKHFPVGVEVEREVWEVLESWNAPLPPD